MVLDVIIRPSWKTLGDICPAIAVLLVHGNKDRLFVVRPLTLFQFRIQVVDKSLSTLLPLSAG